MIVKTLPEVISKIARALNVSLEQAERIVTANLPVRTLRACLVVRTHANALLILQREMEYT